MHGDPEYIAWLEALKPGDEVLVREGSYGMQISRVSRVTKARAFVGHSSYHTTGSRSGSRVGDAGSWSWASIRPVTQEDRDEVEAKRLRAKLRDSVVWAKVPLDQLRAINAIVSEKP